MLKEKKTVSVLGDSISTFDGYTARAGVFYDHYMEEESGVHTVHDTWWMQVIEAMGGELAKNDSFSGSLVYGEMAVSGTSSVRIANLGKYGTPDVILLFMGMNDWANAIPPAEFEAAYDTMLSRITERYPQAGVICGTLLRGADPEDDMPMFMNFDSLPPQKVYSDIIRSTAQKRKQYVADLAAYGVEYTTIDGVHPDAAGMKTIADLWIKELKNMI